MNVFVTRGLGAAVFGALATPAVWADVTAQDVWSDWRDYIATAGYQIEATETVSDDGLTVSNFVMSLPPSEAQPTMSVTLPEIVFTETGDGSVSISMPASIPMRVSGTTEGGEAFDVVLTFDRQDETLIASGDPADTLFSYSAAAVDMAMSELRLDGEPAPQDMARISFSMAGLNSETRMTQGDPRQYSQDMKADSLSYDFGFKGLENNETAAMSGTLNGLTFKGGGAVPENVGGADLSTLMKLGFAYEGQFSFASGATLLQGESEGEEFSLASTSQGGTADFAMDSTHMSYDLSQSQVELTASLSEIPFPVSATMEKAAFKLAMPLAKSDEEQDFSVGMTLGDFTMSDALWNMFDPAAILPHNPATVALDVSGKVRILFDMLDSAVAEKLESTGQAPGELNALTIDKLLVSMVGAELTGVGDFTFDNSDMTTYDGMPKPTGYLDLQLQGGNGLLDKLGTMGLVSEQDAMAARMMMGMFTVPAEAPDTLNAKIEFTGEGQIVANGQRIK